MLVVEQKRNLNVGRFGLCTSNIAMTVKNDAMPCTVLDRVLSLFSRFWSFFFFRLLVVTTHCAAVSVRVCVCSPTNHTNGGISTCTPPFFFPFSISSHSFSSFLAFPRPGCLPCRFARKKVKREGPFGLSSFQTVLCDIHVCMLH